MPEEVLPEYIVQPGFLGIVKIDDVYIRCTEFSMNMEQDVLWYDHTIGLRDSIPNSLDETKGDDGSRNTQKHIWRAGTKVIKGSITFPLTNKNLNVLIDAAIKGDDFEVLAQYTCDISRTFTECKINSFLLKISAGDVATCTADIWALDYTESFASEEQYTDAEKLITWDACDISVGPLTSEETIQSFELTVNNAVRPVYTSGNNLSNSLLPKKFRMGTQDVTGVITIYGKANDIFDAVELNEGSSITVEIANDLSLDLNVLYRPLQRKGTIGPSIHTIPFIGVWGEDVKAIEEG